MASFGNKYAIPKTLATAFTPVEVRELQETFMTFDTSGDGQIDQTELQNIITRLGTCVQVHVCLCVCFFCLW